MGNISRMRRAFHECCIVSAIPAIKFYELPSVPQCPKERKVKVPSSLMGCHSWPKMRIFITRSWQVCPNFPWDKQSDLSFSSKKVLLNLPRQWILAPSLNYGCEDGRVYLYEPCFIFQLCSSCLGGLESLQMTVLHTDLPFIWAFSILWSLKLLLQ
jgi:hypothetical protein